MAVTLTGSGGLFTRLGRIFGCVGAVNSFRGTADLSAASIDSIGNAVDEIRDEYAATRSDLINGLYQARDDHRNVYSSFLTALSTLATNTVIEQVNDDTKLSSKTITPALTELIRQIVNTSDSVDANAVTGAVTADSGNTGDSQVVVSVKDPYGKTLEYSYTESIVVKCSTDSYTGGATAYRETFTLTGAAAEATKLSWNWPKGSGASKTLTSVDAAEDASSNKLTNSDFQDFTSNTPDNWTILVGLAGTDVFEETSVVFRTGKKALKVTGDGATLVSITQTLNSAGGSNIALLPNTVYHLAFWGRKTTSLAAGVLSVQLVDGSNAVITDDASTNNATAFTLSGWTTSYVGKSASFRTPKVLPTTYKLRLILTTAATNGESFYLADMSLAAATQAYTGGPYLSAHGGSTAPVAATGTNAADKWTAAISNDYGGLMQTYAWRVFDMPTLGLILPSDSGGSETIADSLVSAV